MEKRENDLFQFSPINIHATPQHSGIAVQPRRAHSTLIPPCRADVQLLRATTIHAISTLSGLVLNASGVDPERLESVLIGLQDEERLARALSDLAALRFWQMSFALSPFTEGQMR